MRGLWQKADDYDGETKRYIRKMFYVSIGVPTDFPYFYFGYEYWCSYKENSKENQKNRPILDRHSSFTLTH